MSEKELPKVSIIALSYNHKKFIWESLLSIKKQTYPNIELIILDDASTDGSQEILKKWKQSFPEDLLILHEKNMGNCKSFNQGFRMSKGKYIIDFATDDLMVPQRVAKQVEHLENLGEKWGVSYSDVLMIDEQGKPIGTFYKRNKENQIVAYPPSGEVYRHVLGKQVISASSMMIRREVLEKLNGYDESLVYEDYDFWVRSAKIFKYAFLPEVLTYKRVVANSHRSGFYKKDNVSYLESTWIVCNKAFLQNESTEEHHALALTVSYYFQMAVLTHKFETASKLATLLTQLRSMTWKEKVLYIVAKHKIRLYIFFILFILKEKLRNLLNKLNSLFKSKNSFF
ncbi:MAG: glycosyltransferase [Cytophagales bacterium]|nr:glycosyltransferase [Cytophagales bacterium]MDW8384074.1 glycosyltransferase [Flammeovirgaceae bacterium]